MDFLKSVTGKVVTGVVALGVVAASIAFYQAGPEGRGVFFDVSGRILAWVLVVAVVPWVSAGLVAWVARRESNPAGATLVGALTTLEALGLWWAFGWGVGGPVAVTFFVAGVLLAGAYNLLACDWIAERLTG